MVERLAALAGAESMDDGTPGAPLLSIVERRGLGFAQVSAYAAADAASVARALSDLVGAPVLTEAGTSTVAWPWTVLWGGPRRWSVIAPEATTPDLAARLRSAVGAHAQVVDLGHARIAFTLTGTPARGVIAKGSGVDTHSSRFPVGRVAHTSIHHLAATLHLRDASPSFDLYVHRSTALDFWHWLEAATRDVSRRCSVA
ncbi:MAG: hypothetical protein FJX57_09200 [Alphaproteobacteria bacterium]|nr:hypothetical protein [Alphaproteobacteria bacterium]